MRPTSVYDSAQAPPTFTAELQEVIEYRYLLWNLIYRDITVRYKRSWLGAVWIMLNPLLTMLVLAVVFSTRFRSEVENYPVYLLAGLVIWNVFSEASMMTMRSLLAHREIIGKVYVPPGVFPISSALSSLVIHTFELAPLLVITAVLGVAPKLGWLLAVIPLVQTAVLALGVGLMLSALIIYFDDVLNVYDVLLRLFFFVSPIFYPMSILGEDIARLQQLNPLVPLLNSFRRVVFDGRLLVREDFVPATLISLVVLVIGWRIFTRVRFEFAYRV